MLRPVRQLTGIAVVLILLVCQPSVALAGMPSISLTELGRMRFETISFFLLIFFLAAAGVMALWNSLRKDFPRLPRLSYPRALCLVALWGAFFVLLLTMISGARELLTPGAWEKQGVIHKLKERQ